MLWIHGVGHFNPEVEITNQFLEDLDIGTTDTWIMERVGIRTRRTVLPLDYIRTTHNREPREAIEAALYSNAETGRRAAEIAIARAGINLDDIGIVIAGGSSPDRTTPAEACHIAQALGLEVPCFDINSACSTFGAQLYTLSMMQPEALPPFILSVVVENTTRVVDYSDRSAAVLWGDGAAAAVLSTYHPGPINVSRALFASSPAGADKVVVPRLGFFTQQGQAVQKFAITRTVQCLRALREGFPDVPEDQFHFIGHQANRLMLSSVCRMGDIGPEQHHCNVADFGNTAGAGAVSVLSGELESFTRGDHVAMVGVGSGLSWSSLMLRFDKQLPAQDSARQRVGGGADVQAGGPYGG